MAPLSKLIFALALTGAAAKDYSALIKTHEEGAPVALTWNEESDKAAVAQTFVNTHTGDIEGLGCTKGDAECFTAVLFTHMLKTEEGAELPALNLGADFDIVEHEHEQELTPFESGQLIREAEDFKELEIEEMAPQAAVPDKEPMPVISGEQ